ncbi:MAG: DUF3108 domain-containing protein [Casimicrobiaceae bacterium]
MTSRNQPAGTLAAPPVRRVRRVFWVALGASVAVHALWSLWPAPTPGEVAEPVLTATLETLPPPPRATANPAPPSSIASAQPTRPQPARPQVTRPQATRSLVVPPIAAAREHARATETPKRASSSASGMSAQPPLLSASASQDTLRESDADAPSARHGVNAGGESIGQGGARSGSDAAKDTDEANAGADANAVKLPPRVDLAYEVFLGTRGFMIGDATYRFEHDGDRYRISTVGEARGLAALFIHGTGKVESRGLITPTGLKPLEFAIERGSPDKREIAYFDWAGETVSLNDGRTASLEAPAFDPLTILWQPYFSPPTGANELTFSLATTRKVARYTLTREGDERLAWRNGTIVTERWHRVSEDGKTETWFWLAPSLHFIPVRMRATRTSRGTLEAKLASIRVDSHYAGFDSDPAGPVPLPEPVVQRPSPFNDLTP